MSQNRNDNGPSNILGVKKDFKAIISGENWQGIFFSFFFFDHIFYELILFPKKAFTWAIVIFNIFHLLHKSKPLSPYRFGVFLSSHSFVYTLGTEEV